MATKPIVLDPLEELALIATKANLILAHVSNYNVDAIGRELSRMSELYLDLKEKIAAMPMPPQPEAQAGKRN